MSQTHFVLQARVGPHCENRKPDVQTVKMLFNRINLRHLGIEYLGGQGECGPALETAINIFQMQYVPDETRPNRYIVAPHSATWRKLVEMSKQGSEEAALWNQLTPAQRQKYEENMQLLKIRKENWKPLYYDLGLALQSLLNTYPRALGWLQSLVGSTEKGITLVQAALSSAQLLAFGYMLHKLGVGVKGMTQALTSFFEVGGPGTAYLQRLANAFVGKSFADVVGRTKNALGGLGVVLIVVKAGVYFAQARWKQAFFEIVKGVASLAAPLFGVIDAIFSLLELVFPSLVKWPAYRLVKSLNPADLIGNGLANIMAIIDLAFTAWGRNDWTVTEAIEKMALIVLKELATSTLRAILSRIYMGWEQVVWIAEWFREIARKLVGYGLPAGGRVAVALA
jgi:hypothetical protein